MGPRSGPRWPSLRRRGAGRAVVLWRGSAPFPPPRRVWGGLSLFGRAPSGLGGPALGCSSRGPPLGFSVGAPSARGCRSGASLLPGAFRGGVAVVGAPSRPPRVLCFAASCLSLRGSRAPLQPGRSCRIVEASCSSVRGSRAPPERLTILKKSNAHIPKSERGAGGLCPEEAVCIYALRDGEPTSRSNAPPRSTSIPAGQAGGLAKEP